MTEKVLFVDDEQNFLDGIRRQLRKKINAETATGPVEGLRTLNKKGPFAVVVVDIGMPLIDGIKFLTRVQQMAPETVRMILTGNANMENAINAVNSGHVFRFMTKPCPTDTLMEMLQAGIEQYRLIRAEKELLEQTLKGSIKVLSEIMSMLAPEAFARASRVRRCVLKVAIDLGLSDLWKIETAAMLSQIGFAVLPGLSVENLYQNDELSIEEAELLSRHAEVAYNLLRHIPRMEEVAGIIRDQNKDFEPIDPDDIGEIPAGHVVESAILKTVCDYDRYIAIEDSAEKAVEEMKRNQHKYDPKIINSLEKVVSRTQAYEERQISISELETGMIIREEVRTINGILLIGKGQEVGDATIERLANYARSDQGVQEPIYVDAPLNRRIGNSGIYS